MIRTSLKKSAGMYFNDLFQNRRKNLMDSYIVFNATL